VTLRFNTFYRNTGDQLREDAPGGVGVIDENIVAEGGAHGFGLVPGSGYQGTRNLLWDNADIAGGTTSQEIVADPIFDDPSGPDGILGANGEDDDDFRLLPGSGALDAGSFLARDTVLATHEPLSARSTRPDGTLDWSGTDLAATH